MTNNQ